MNSTGYLLDVVLILLVVRQMRGRRLAGMGLYLPLAIVGYVVFRYLNTIPTTGNDPFLIVGAMALGVTLGTLCARYSVVTIGDDGVPFARATGVAAALWIAGVGTRLAFSLYVAHGGGPSVLRFDRGHDITTVSAWVAALILMALVEVVSRTIVLLVRGHKMKQEAAALATFGGGRDLVSSSGATMGGREG